MVFHADDFITPQSKVYNDRIKAAADSTFLVRIDRVKGLQAEILSLREHISDLKDQEVAYMRANSLFASEVGKSEMGPDGKLVYETYTTRPEMRREDGGTALMSMPEVLGPEDSPMLRGPGITSSLPEVTLAQEEMYRKMRHLNKNLLRYAHLIKNADLMMRVKLRALELLNDEMTKAGITQ